MAKAGRINPKENRETDSIPVGLGATISSGLSTDPEIDPSDLDQVETETEDFFDNLAELFAEGSQRVKVQVIRVAPTYVGDVKMHGYCCYLKPGQDIEWLAQNYGGGTYKIVKWVNGQKAQTLTVDIAGEPIRKSPGLILKSQNGQTPAVNDALDGFEFMGVKADGDDARFFSRLERVILMQSLLERKRQPDLNVELMRTLLEKSNANSLDGMLDAMTKLRDVAEAILPVEKQADSGFLGVLGEGIKAFTALVQQNQNQRPQQVAGLSAPKPLPAPALAVIEAPQPQNEGGDMNLSEANQIAQTCVNALVSAYGTQTPEEAVEGIRILLPELTPLVKALIKNQKTALWSLTRMAANEAYDSFEVAALETYFDRVINLLTAE